MTGIQFGDGGIYKERIRKKMLETIDNGLSTLVDSYERVKLLKKGFTTKEIEKAYLIANKIRMIKDPILYLNFD